eukprot:5240038-Amphidinium_carterae.2
MSKISARSSYALCCFVNCYLLISRAFKAVDQPPTSFAVWALILQGSVTHISLPRLCVFSPPGAKVTFISPSFHPQKGGIWRVERGQHVNQIAHEVSGTSAWLRLGSVAIEYAAFRSLLVAGCTLDL